MANSTQRARIYLALAVIGTMLPLLAVAPWLAEHGPDPGLFIRELFANRISAFFGWDVIVSAITLLVALVLSPGKLTTVQRTGIAVGTLCVGVSLGLPLLLYFREQAGMKTGE